MKRPTALLLAAVLVTSCQQRPAQDRERGVVLSPFEKRVLLLLNAEHPTEESHRELVGYGERAFPIYERLLTDPEVDPLAVSRVLNALRSIPEARSRFHGHTLRLLADPHYGWDAARLLEKIGSREDAPPLVALLWNSNIMINWAAMEALAALGGERELAALDLWAKPQAEQLRINGYLRDHFQKTRDTIRRRVEEEKKNKAG